MAGAASDSNIIVLLFVLSGLIAFAWVFRTGRAEAVPDGPEDEPYRIYTTDHDLELHGAEVVDALPDASLDRKRGHLHRNPSTWTAWIGRTDELRKQSEHLPDALLPALRAAMAGLDPSEIAVTLLIDQSGSMKGEPIAQAAAAADLFVRLLGSLGVRSEVLGFSTAGWRGGRPREAWKRAGRPARPGRLCALTHVIYKDVSEPEMADAARRAIVHPDLLRENVDGEAVLWARDRLANLPVQHRLLLVLSDGAPVDDSTLQHNEPSILSRHIVKVVREVEEGGLIVGGLGINYRVENYYPLSEAVTDLDLLPEAMARVLARMLMAASERNPTAPA